MVLLNNRIIAVIKTKLGKKCYKKDKRLGEIFDEVDSKIKYKKIKFLLYTPVILLKKVFKI